MFATLRHLAMRAFMMLWASSSSRSWQGFPRPDGGPPIRVGGPQQRRLLLCGSGIAVGYGVSSHELALGGSLARALTAIDKRGYVVDTVTSPRLTMKNAQTVLERRRLHDVDAIVLSFGTFEALSLMPTKTWSRQFDALVRFVLTTTQSDAEVFFIECNAPKMSTFPARYRRRLLLTVDKFNVNAAACARKNSRVHFVPFAPTPEDPESLEGHQRYREWASMMAPSISAVLNRTQHHGGN